MVEGVHTLGNLSKCGEGGSKQDMGMFRMPPCNNCFIIEAKAINASQEKG